MGRWGALRQINVVKEPVIFKEDINPTCHTGVPAIAPAAGKSWAMRQNQMPRFMIPAACKAFAGDADSYQYLAESIRMHPDQGTLLQMLDDAGFANTDFHNMTGGIVALHRGVKP